MLKRKLDVEELVQEKARIIAENFFLPGENQ